MQHFRNKTLRNVLFEGLCLYFAHCLRHVRKKTKYFGIMWKLCCSKTLFAMFVWRWTHWTHLNFRLVWCVLKRWWARLFEWYMGPLKKTSTYEVETVDTRNFFIVGIFERIHFCGTRHAFSSWTKLWRVLDLQSQFFEHKEQKQWCNCETKCN